MTISEMYNNVENMPTTSIVKWLNFFERMGNQHKTASTGHNTRDIIDLVNRMHSELEQRGEQEVNANPQLQT